MDLPSWSSALSEGPAKEHLPALSTNNFLSETNEALILKVWVTSCKSSPGDSDLSPDWEGTIDLVRWYPGNAFRYDIY